jgi:putative ABC transport system permease protein
MSRTSRYGTVGLLLRHLRSGAAASVLVAVLVAAAVLAVALAPRALIRLGTAELRHELGDKSPALLDLSGTGRIGLVDGLPENAPLEDIVGATDVELRNIPTKLPDPLAQHVGPMQWAASTRSDDGILPTDLPVRTILTLAIDLDYADRIDIVDGAMPEPWTGDEAPLPDAPPQPLLEIAISRDAADELQLSVGDVVGWSPADVVIAGIFEPKDPGDAYWVHQYDLATPTIARESGQLPKVHVTAYLDPLSIGHLTGTFSAGKLTGFMEVDPSGMDYADTGELQTQVRQLMATEEALPFFGSISFRSGLADAIAGTVQRVTAASALLALSVSGLLGVLLAVFALGVQSVIARRRPALALAAARGAGALQLRSAMVLEGMLIAFPGAALAIAAAAVIIPGPVGIDGWIAPVALALAPPVLFAVLTSPRRLRDPRGDLQVRSRTRSRWIAEVAVVGLAALSLFLLARRGLVESSQAVGIDPLLAATPLLLAAAVCIGVLRLYPAPLLGVQRLLRRRRGSAGVLGAARAIRDPALGFAAALSLVVGISVVVFSTVMAGTIRSGLEQAARDAVGADVQVAAQSLPSDLVDEIAEVDGVRAVAAVAIVSGVELTIERNPTEVYVVMADTAALHEVRPDIPVIDTKVDGRIPLLVSSDWSDRVVGASLLLGPADAVDRGIIPATSIPGATRHYVFIDSAFASEVGTSARDPERVLIRLDDGVAASSVTAGLDEMVTAAQPEDYRGLVDVSDAESALAETRAAPAVGSLETALLLAALASLLLTMLTVVLASVAAATARNRLVGVLRILGMSPRQLRAVQAWELGPVAITAIVVGTALGLVLPLIVTNALDLRPFLGGRLQPGPAFDPVWVAAAVGAFALVVLFAGAIAGALGRRFAPAGTLKMGEG